MLQKSCFEFQFSTYIAHWTGRCSVGRPLPTVPPRCRRDRACLFWGSLKLCGRATHAWQVHGEIPNQAGLALPGRICSSDVNRDGVTPEEEPISLRKAKLESATWEGPDTGLSVCQGYDNRSNEISCTWHHAELKEWLGFLVSRSLLLSSAHV